MAGEYMMHSFTDRDPVELELTFSINASVAEDMTLGDFRKLREHLLKSVNEDGNQWLREKGHVA